MSEKEPIKLEQEKIEVNVELSEDTSKESKPDIVAEEQESAKKAEAARTHIETIAKSKEDTPITNESTEKNNEDIRWTSSELLSQTYQRTLVSVRNRLSKPEKTFSKTVHNPLVEKASDLAGSTIARPSGILFGSIFSFIGSLVGYIIARRLGGEIPYSIFAFMFVVGFVFGLILEMLIVFYKKRKLR